MKGIIAGINAALSLDSSKAPFVVDRADGYLGSNIFLHLSWTCSDFLSSRCIDR